jgi:TusA-related sulfurtransferase
MSIQNSDYFIDITNEVCPMTFVKTKLAVERMETGKIIEVRLKGSEPLHNVPRSLVELGHVVVDFQPEEGESETGIHRLKILKK